MLAVWLPGLRQRAVHDTRGMEAPRPANAHCLVVLAINPHFQCQCVCCPAGYDLVEIASFNAANLDAAMTKRVFQQHGMQAACSLGLTLDADISSDSDEVR